jgi:hypothetical protein
MCMNEDADDIGELFRATEVGDTICMQMVKDQLHAEARDRVSPILEPPTAPNGRPIFRGFRKDAGGMWDLESVTSARGSSLVEIIIRRAASDL